MWIFTKEGFFSVVQDDYCKEDELMVRARVKGDLERLKEKITTEPGIITLGHADYLYRMPVLREDWASYLHGAAMELDYSNVKGTICEKNKNRQIAYFGVWSSMTDLQRKEMIASGDWEHLPVWKSE